MKKVIKNKKGVAFRIALGVLICLCVVLSSHSFAATEGFAGYIGWVGTYVTPANYINNQNGNGHPLAHGSLIQIIYVGHNGIPDSPKPDGSVGGDDVLLTQEAVGDDYQFGNFRQSDGMYYDLYQGTFESSDGTPKVYARAWNGPTPAASTYYGNSALVSAVIMPAPVPPFDPANFPISFSTLTSYTPAGPQILSVSPVAGQQWDSVVISGNNFGPSGTVNFIKIGGSTNHSAALVGPWGNTITVQVPSYGSDGPGDYIISVTNPSGTSNWQTFYYAVPYITGESPASGPAGTVGAVLLGYNFGTIGGTVTFDNNTGSPLHPSGTFNNHTVTYNVPSGVAAGPYDVSVIVGGVSSNKVTFTVNASVLTPAITGVLGAPFYVGNSVITIEGTNLGASPSGNSVTIGGAPMTTTNWTATSITGTIPNSITAGTPNVVVTTSGGASNAYGITCYPYLTSLSTSDGIVGTPVTLNGYGFGASQGTSSIAFGGTAVTTYTNWSNTSVQVNAPAAGNVVLTFQPGGLASNGLMYSLVNGTGPVIYSLNPSQGVAGTTVTIVGNNFGYPKGPSTVMFGAIPVAFGPSDGWLNNLITVEAPAGVSTCLVDVNVSGVGASNGMQFTVNVSGSGPLGPSKPVFESAGGIMMAYPNPFDANDTAHPLQMLFGATTGEAVDIYIFDTNGRVIWQNKDAQLSANRIVTWDGYTAYGQIVENGLYIIRVVESGKLVAKGKILVIKKKH